MSDEESSRTSEEPLSVSSVTQESLDLAVRPNEQQPLQRTDSRRFPAKTRLHRALEVAERHHGTGCSQEDREKAIPDFLVELAGDLKQPSSWFRHQFNCAAKKDPDAVKWCDRLASILAPVAAKGSGDTLQEMLRSLKIAPIREERWIRLSTRKIYFPTAEGGFRIPDDLGYILLSDMSRMNSEWERIFTKMGVKSLEPLDVVRKIEKKYGSWEEPQQQPIPEQSRRNLDYLFQIKRRSLHRNIRLIDHCGQYQDRFDLHGQPCLYIYDTEDEYGAFPLLKYFYLNRLRAQSKGSGPPLRQVHFIHPAYLDPPAETGKDKEWREWLSKVADIRQAPSLWAGDGTDSGKFSDDFNFICSCQDEKVLGLLLRHWEHYKPGKTEKARWSALGELEILMEDKNKSRLKNAYVRSEKLSKLCRELGFDNSLFLACDRSLLMEDGRKDILKSLGAHLDDDWEFYARIFEKLQKIQTDAALPNVSGPRSIPPRGLFATVLKGSKTDDNLRTFHTLLRKMQERCLDEDDAKSLREKFESQKLRIPFPTAGSSSLEWVPAKDCLWDGPDGVAWPTSKRSLCPRYADLRRLFTDVLQVTSLTIDDVVNELANLRNQTKVPSVADVTVLLKCIESFERVSTGSSDSKLKSDFDTKTLIFIPDPDPNAKNPAGNWRPASSCVWAPRWIEIPDKIAIGGIYPSLSKLFLKILRLNDHVIEDHVDRLIDWTCTTQSVPPANQGEARAAEARRMLGILSLLNPDIHQVKSLLTARVFPVRLPNRQEDAFHSSEESSYDGRKALCTLDTDFIIPDDELVYSGFKDEVIMLDMTVAEAQVCSVLFQVLGLKGRNGRLLSSRVKRSYKPGGLLESKDWNHLIQSRAMAIFRCARHFLSPIAFGDFSVYFSFKTCTAYSCWMTDMDVSVYQNGVAHNRKMAAAQGCLREVGTRLELHIPGLNKKAANLYRLKDLPKQVAQYLHIEDPRAVGLLSMVFNAPDEDGLLEALLAESGVARLSPEEEAAIARLESSREDGKVRNTADDKDGKKDERKDETKDEKKGDRKDGNSDEKKDNGKEGKPTPKKIRRQPSD